jgi:hypothetical protein
MGFSAYATCWTTLLGFIITHCAMATWSDLEMSKRNIQQRKVGEEQHTRFASRRLGQDAKPVSNS